MKTLLLIFIPILSLPAVYGQNRVSYVYDSAGNRTEKVIQLTKSAVSNDSTYHFVDMVIKRELKIYPNPTRGQITVDIPDTENLKSGELVVYNLTGQTMERKKVTSPSMQLDISSSASGIYILHVRLDGETSTWKIIKE
jgi:hypothetical protein